MTTDVLYHRKPELVAAEMDGERVMMDIRSGKYFSLRGVGGFIWDQIENPTSINTVVAAVEAAFETSDHAEVEQDVSAFMDQMIEAGLVMASNG